MGGNGIMIMPVVLLVTSLYKIKTYKKYQTSAEYMAKTDTEKKWYLRCIIVTLLCSVLVIALGLLTYSNIELENIRFEDTLPKLIIFLGAVGFVIMGYKHKKIKMNVPTFIIFVLSTIAVLYQWVLEFNTDYSAILWNDNRYICNR